MAKTHLKRGRFRAALPVRAALGLALSFGTAAPALARHAATPETRPPLRTCESRAEHCFVLMGLTIDGVTAYPLKTLAPLYADYLTREVSITDLARIAQAITDKYRADGYFLSRAVVPPQSGPEGVAHLIVYEGRVSEVQLTGPAAPAVRGLLDGVTAERPLRLADLERRLTLGADRPGLKLTSELQPIMDDPASHRLVVQADRQRLTGSLYADNRGAGSAGPWQLYGRMAVNSAVIAGDQAAVSVLTTPEDPRAFAQTEVSYLYPLQTGGSLSLHVSNASARDAAAHLNAVVGNENRALDLRLSHPLSRGRNHALWAAVSLDAVEVEQNAGAGNGYRDELRVLRGSLFATRQTESRTTVGFLQVSRGLDALGATESAGANHSRWNADGQFWKVNLYGSHYRDLGSKAGIYVQAEGQWSPDALLVSEEFAVGARPYGRAYNFAEITGRAGAGALAELRYGFAPKGGALSFFQLYGFADAAKVWRKGAAPGYGSAALASAGGGARLTFARKATLQFELAKPLTRTPYVTGDKGWRTFVSLSAGF